MFTQLNLTIIRTLLMVLLSTFVIKIHWAFENDINRLGVDFGPQLIGLAISTRYYEQALCTIRNKANVLRVCQHILDTADKHNTKEIIVGIPLLEGQKLPLDNKDWLTFNGRMCYDFASALGAVALNRSTEFQVRLFDESYTTKQAKYLSSLEKAQGTLDGLSALCLLKGYISDKGKGSQEVEPAPFPLPRSIGVFDYSKVLLHHRKESSQKFRTNKLVRVVRK